MRTSVQRYLDALKRIDTLDRTGPRLNSITRVYLDKVKSEDKKLPLSGRIFSVKESLAVEGTRLFAGSPALATVDTNKNATVVDLMMDAGARLIGKTNMPPLAIGGGQAGVGGRTKSPFNPLYLAAAWHSGSSIGSAVSVAAGLCDFGLGAETVSSGRSPASNNGLVAYTPSWGIISEAGNFPLHVLRDTIVPHVDSVESMRLLVSLLAEKDPGSVWYQQSSLSMQSARETISELRDRSYSPGVGRMRLGVPRQFIGKSDSTTGSSHPIRKSIIQLWEKLVARLEGLGVEIVEVDFPLLEYFENSPNSRTIGDQFIDIEWDKFELGSLMTYTWQEFFANYTDGFQISDLNPFLLRPSSPFSTDLKPDIGDHEGRDAFNYFNIVHDVAPDRELVMRRIDRAVERFNRSRQVLYEDWLDQLKLDGLIFPANADVGKHYSEIHPGLAEIAWREGNIFSHGNHVIRRTGIPTLTLPMGIMEDTQMPVGFTLAGRAWSDANLLAIGAMIENSFGKTIVAEAPLPDIGVAPIRFSNPVSAQGDVATVQQELPVKILATDVGEIIEVEIESLSCVPVQITLLGQSCTVNAGETVQMKFPVSAWPLVSDPFAIMGFDQGSTHYIDVRELRVKYINPDDYVGHGDADES